MQANRPFSIMVKPAGSLCNMRCRYCYYIDNRCSEHVQMKEEVLEKMISDYFSSVSYPVVSFVWHGGEPTLRGLDFYKKAVEIQKKYAVEGVECWNNLQTNGLNLNEEWCAFLKENSFDVGVSIDGMKAIHDEYRHTANGEPTYDLIKKNIECLQSYGIQPDLLCTVSEEVANHAYSVYNNLKHFRNGWVQFIPIVNFIGEGEVSEESVKPESYGKFLCEMFKLWVTRGFPDFNIQLFMELLNVYMGGNASLCWLQETCGSALVVESDGGIYACDHFVNKEHYRGNIQNISLAQAINSEQQMAFGNAKRDALSERCHSCRYLRLCNGGCQKDRMQNKENFLCEGYLAFFEYSERAYLRIAELLKSGCPPYQVAEKLKKEKLL